MLREMLDVFSLRVATDLTVAPTNSNIRQAKSAAGNISRFAIHSNHGASND
jgi:hypothetical protein